jgi:beta-glucanase (GH16 family)
LDEMRFGRDNSSKSRYLRIWTNTDLRAVVVVGALVVLLACTVTAAPKAKWALVWHDEFSGSPNSAPDRRRWIYDLGNGGWGNHELENYTSNSENAYLDGRGHLAIRAVRNESGEYTSARLKTQGLFEVRYGRIEAKIKIPRGQGIWPAFWMLGYDISRVGWPTCGEIDIMENIGREPSVIHGTVHGPNYSGGKAISARKILAPNARFAERFYVFGVEWSPQAIVFLLNHVAYAKVSPDSLPNGARWVFDRPFFLLLNLAVGGDWPGNPDSTTRFPQIMFVDWVRVWRPSESPGDDTADGRRQRESKNTRTLRNAMVHLLLFAGRGI